jgi:hypothetical protein
VRRHRGGGPVEHDKELEGPVLAASHDASV